MQESSSALQFLKELREENGKRIWSMKAFNRYLDAKARQLGLPLTGQFELTPLCNFGCKMCYVHLNADQLQNRKVLSVEKWKELMHQAWEGGMLHVTLSGGECLTYPGFDELYCYLQDLGCDITILTNGYLLNDQRIKFFKDRPPSMIQISLYGWNDDVYERVTGVRAFTTVRNNIQKVAEAGFYFRLVITPSTYLGEDILETIRVARSITNEVSINSAVFPPRKETGRSQQRDNPPVDLFIRAFRLIHELNGVEIREIDPQKLPPAGGTSHECNKCGLLCGGGSSGFVVDWKGNMMPCNSLDMIQANIFKEGFRESWVKIRKGVSEWPWVPECQGCAYYEVCHRCAGIMLQYASPGKQPTEMCEQIRCLAQHGLIFVPECD